MPDPLKWINPQQIAGIDSYTFADGPARGGRALCVNTGGGLRYRVLPDRGLDIDQAFFGPHSLAFLSHGGVTRPDRALDRDEDWHKGWPAGLLTSCGPMNVGPPGMDEGQRLGRHGTHSNTAATIQSIIQPDPRRDQFDLIITGTVKYGEFYGPNLELHRTIRSTLGSNSIRISDEFVNLGNTPVPHAWLLHINFGYPLVDAGAKLCFDSPSIEPLPFEESQRRFAAGSDFRTVPDVLDHHHGSACAVAYLTPRSGKDGNATVGIVNPHLNLGVAITYSTQQFPRCGNWQHFGAGEYVTALEPMNGTVDGRAADRARGLLDIIEPSDHRRYDYRIDVLDAPADLDRLLSLGL